ETGSDGSFTLDVPIPEGFGQDIQFAVVVTQDGFAGRDTQYVNATENFDLIDYGRIELTTGYSVPVLVVGASGEPIAGAVIEPQSDYALRRQATRSGADGRAILRNLPSGLLSVSVRYGNQMASPKLFISEDDAENGEVTLRLS